MTNTDISRRRLLKGASLLGCSLAAHPLLSNVTFASVPGDNRLVVLILRGGMDGLDVVQPVGDKNFANARPTLRGDASNLNGFFAMHDGLASLRPLWQKGELAFVQAVSTPYRDKRSHFDGQDLLEAGTANDISLASRRDGWLNRLLQTMPGSHGKTAFAIGRENMKILSGPAAISNWSPETSLKLDPQTRRLLEQLYKNDPLFNDAVLEAMDLAESISADMASGDTSSEMMEAMMQETRSGSEIALAAFAADRLNRETRIASFSINGWDTHRNQAGAINTSLETLAQVILTLKKGLGPNWDRTTVMALTEFGRTARENGTGGTDHGTGGAVILAGGAVKGGQVFGRWPGLAEADLYDRRDLMPTADVRAYAAWAMRDMFGIEKSVLERSIFPELDMGIDPRIIR